MINRNKNYQNITTFLNAYCPWNNPNKNNELRKLYEKFLNKDADFSWLSVENSLEVGKVPLNTKYGVPSHVHGDLLNGKLFLCLSNPNIAIKDNKEKLNNKNINSLDDYYNSSAGNTGDFSLNHEHFENIDIIQDYIMKNGATGGILYRELEELERYIKTDELRERINEKYYLTHYYHHLIFAVAETKKSGGTIIEKLEEIMKSDSYKKIKALAKGFVNLEAIPFRSQNPSSLKQIMNQYSSKVRLFSARIIIFQILYYEQNNSSTEPIFVFRRFNDFWKKAIETVLENDFKLSEAEINDRLNDYHKKYFYTFCKQDHKGSSKAVISEKIRQDDEQIGPDKFKHIIEKLSEGIED